MKKGFTLIELLVVISIIGILAGLTLTGFSAARKNARDTQRKSDLGQYRVALEAYASNNNGQYPDGGNRITGTGSLDGYGSRIFANPGPLIPNYLPSQILPPVKTTDWSYVCWYTLTQYICEANLETGGYWEICSDGRAGKVLVENSTQCLVP